MIPNLVNEHVLHAFPSILKDVPKYSGKYFLMYQKSSKKYIFAKYESINKERHGIFLEDSVSVLGDMEKYLLICQAGLYHTLFNTIPSILYLHKQDPSTVFILNTSSIYGRQEEATKIIDFLKLFLDSNQIQYRLVTNADKIVVDNVKFLNEFSIKAITDIAIISEVREWILQNTNAKDLQKIYISRSKSNAEKRIDDEGLLEKYLSDLGFYIFYPEDSLSICDQLEHFSNAKVVVSITSSGMSNALTMRPGSILIELVTPFQFGGKFEGVDMLHQLYSVLAYSLDLNYVGIPNKTKNVFDLINYIESNSKIKSLLL